MGSWSASRVGTYDGCPLRYMFQYVRWFKRVPDNSNVFAKKGLAFHETVEQYKSGMSKEELKEILNKKLIEYEVDTSEYNEDKGIEKFLIFWDVYIATKEQEGYVVKQEQEVKGTIFREPFKGYIDLLVEGPNDCIIYDYKTGRKMDPSKYKNQLILYAYLKALERGWTIDQVAEKVKLRIFYPLAEPGGEDLSEEALRCMRDLVYDRSDVDAVIKDFYQQNILKILTTKWDEFTGDEGIIGHDCAYCPYSGAAPVPEIGFIGCKKSIALGTLPPEGSSIVKN